MKKLSLLLTTAILATSSVALADHTSAPGTAPGAPTVRDHRFDDDFAYDDLDGKFVDRHDKRFLDDDSYEYRDGRWMRRPMLRWETLGTLGAGKAILNLDHTPGRFKSLKLDIRGRMRINRVVVLFADGTRQVMAMRSAAGRGAAPVLDLGSPRKIHSIIVYSSPWSRGSVTVTGLKMNRFARRF
jgi:hypothetical protein